MIQRYCMKYFTMITRRFTITDTNIGLHHVRGITHRTHDDALQYGCISRSKKASIKDRLSELSPIK